ncbi:phosphotransferase [Verrucosispora sp. WMMA2044]|nr:phosphotransferase [Verrucosispora sp. WMMA2044]WBB49763.1 phosphotransferase [Verrucosispora sp. WMMA2044]
MLADRLGHPAAGGGTAGALTAYAGRRLATSPCRPPARTDVSHLDTGPASLTGDTLCHVDLRADNLLVDRTGRVTVVDWPSAARGPACWTPRPIVEAAVSPILLPPTRRRASNIPETAASDRRRLRNIPDVAASRPRRPSNSHSLGTVGWGVSGGRGGDVGEEGEDRRGQGG